MYLVISKWVIAVKFSNFSDHYLRNRSTLDIGVLGYIGLVWPKELSPEVWHITPGTPCIYRVIYKSLRNFRPLRYSSRDGHAEGEHVNRGRDTPVFCSTLQVLDMSTPLCLSWLLRSRVRKFQRDLWITLFVCVYIYIYQCCKRRYSCVQPEEGFEEAETCTWNLLIHKILK